jgi:hypothetical protein
MEDAYVWMIGAFVVGLIGGNAYQSREWNTKLSRLRETYTHMPRIPVKSEPSGVRSGARQWSDVELNSGSFIEVDPFQTSMVIWASKGWAYQHLRRHEEELEVAVGSAVSDVTHAYYLWVRDMHNASLEVIGKRPGNGRIVLPQRDKK